MRYPPAITALLCLSVPVWGAEPTFRVKPSTARSGERVQIAFAVSATTDVEVAILDAQGKIVRHLAAGVLGGTYPPPAPLAAGLTQKLNWDGKDDDGRPVADPKKCTVRVRAGMRAALKQIVGGDPYAYYSDEMGDSDHSPWGIAGLEAKPDGKVYVLGHSSNLGPPALRQYDADGNYLRTLFPPPAGKDASAMKGWGINVRPDGTYAPKFNKLTDPSLTTTFLDTKLGMAQLVPTPQPDRLTLWRSSHRTGCLDLMMMHTDGTIAAKADQREPGPIVKQPPFPLGPVEPNSHFVHSLLGPRFTCYAPDGKSLYLSGLFAGVTRYGSVHEVPREGFWRDGQVWRVDTATGTAQVFFALSADSIPTGNKERTTAFGGGPGYSALHGVAVDQHENLFVCDRLNQRVRVLDKQGKELRQLPVEYPDAVAVNPRTGALYVTTRWGDYHKRGEVQLLKFDNWQRDEGPSATTKVSKTGYTTHRERSYLAVCEGSQGTNVWVAYTQMPVRIYRDGPQGLTLLKDFFRVDGAQRCLGFDRMQVDARSEEVYLLDSHDTIWKVADWSAPKFIKLPLRTASIAIDARQRHLYARTLADGASSNSVGRIARFQLDQPDYPPANFGETGTNRLTTKFVYEWCFEGNADKGMAVAANGNVAIVGMPKDGLRLFAGSQDQVPWNAVTLRALPNNAGGVRFDRAGNLYVGIADKPPSENLPGFQGDRFAAATGRIYKYAPTGSLASGNLFPKPPEGPAHVYDVPYGAFETDCVTRSPRFGIDGFGRICFPTNIAPRVTVMDNAGNEILHFGRYGNRDSCGGLAGDLVPTSGVPLAFPNSVDATDDYLYVADMVNLRLLRLAKQFALEATAAIP